MAPPLSRLKGTGMPYIKQNERTEATEKAPDNAGQLNYAITKLCQEYLARKGLAYAALNEVVGALECAKLELYRRIAAPYEDRKILENGDVRFL